MDSYEIGFNLPHLCLREKPHTNRSQRRESYFRQRIGLFEKSFLEKFHNKYFPKFVCQQKEVEFMTFTQDTKTVAQDEANF